MSAKGGTKNAERAGSGAAPVSATAATLGNGQTSLSEDEIKRMIAEAAYFRAAQRGFAPGGEIGDWLAAEREIRGALEASRMAPRPDDAVVGQARPRRDVPVETPPADATERERFKKLSG